MRRTSLMVSAATMAITSLSGVRSQAQINFSNFSSTTGFVLNGADFFGNPALPTTVSNRLRLNAATNNVRGSAFYAVPQRVANGFSAAFQFQITAPGGVNDAVGQPGGDGIAFVLQNDPRGAMALGPNTSAAGYFGITPSLDVELDTFYNSDASSNDPDGNHISVHLNGNINEAGGSLGLTNRNGVPALPINLSDGNLHTITLNYAGTVLNIYADGIAAPILTINNLNIGSLIAPDGMAYVGFAAGTGGAYENHDIASFAFTPAVVPEPGAWTLLTPGMLCAGTIALRRRRCR